MGKEDSECAKLGNAAMDADCALNVELEDMSLEEVERALDVEEDAEEKLYVDILQLSNAGGSNGTEDGDTQREAGGEAMNAGTKPNLPFDWPRRRHAAPLGCLHKSYEK